MIKTIFDLSLSLSKLLLKNKLSFVASVFVVLLLGSFIAHNFYTNLKNKLLLDFLIFGGAFVLHISSLFFAMTLSQKYQEDFYGSPYISEAKPHEYLISIFYALFLATFAISCALFLIFEIVGILYDIKNQSDLILQLWLQVLSATLLSYILFTLALFMEQITAIFFAILSMAIGFGLNDAYLYFDGKDFELLFKFFYSTLPNFSFFDISSTISNKTDIDRIKVFFYSLVYCKLYSLLTLGIALKKFNNAPNSSN